MAVVKKDIVVHGMLQDELDRCERLAASLEAVISEHPKGSLHKRNMKYKEKVSSYHYLKFREGSKSVYKHVPEREVDDLGKRINLRRKKEKELKQFKDRIKYLKKLLRSPRAPSGHQPIDQHCKRIPNEQRDDAKYPGLL